MPTDRRRTIQSFGEVIRQRRGELGLTQEELAERVGEHVRQSDISRMERDYVSLPRRDRLDALAAALEVTPGYLLMRSGWITREELDSMESPAPDGSPEPSEPLSLEVHTIESDATTAVESTAVSERASVPHVSLELQEAIAHAREVSLKTEELLRRTSSTMEHVRRPGRAPR